MLDYYVVLLVVCLLVGAGVFARYQFVIGKLEDLVVHQEKAGRIMNFYILVCVTCLACGLVCPVLESGEVLSFRIVIALLFAIASLGVFMRLERFADHYRRHPVLPARR